MSYTKITSASPSNIPMNSNTDSNCIETKQTVNVINPSSSISLSPQSSKQTDPLSRYLPNDLIKRIDTISPVNNDYLSSSISDIDMTNDSNSEEDDEVYLNQYDEIKCDFSPSNQFTKSEHKLSSASNSSLNSLSTASTSNYLNQMKLMQFMNKYYTMNNYFPETYNQYRKLSEQTEQRKSSVNEIKKKKKKKKKNDGITIEMFGRRGWICEQCNNFNYESRSKCNRCGIVKQPVLVSAMLNKEEIKSNNKCDRKGDWCCYNCKNLNFAFRSICNRCQMNKEDSYQAYIKENSLNSKEFSL